MRCVSCNKILSDFEATRKGALSGHFLDLCNSCLSTTDIEVVERDDLKHSEDDGEWEDV